MTIYPHAYDEDIYLRLIYVCTVSLPFGNRAMGNLFVESMTAGWATEKPEPDPTWEVTHMGSSFFHGTLPARQVNLLGWCRKWHQTEAWKQAVDAPVGDHWRCQLPGVVPHLGLQCGHLPIAMSIVNIFIFLNVYIYIYIICIRLMKHSSHGRSKIEF